MIISKNGLIHHVFFYLHQPGDPEALRQLTQGLERLSSAPTIREFHIGKPASTRREVIDSTYDLSWLLLFDTREDQDAYQTDPVHLQFVEECAHLWRKVAVFDTIGI